MRELRAKWISVFLLILLATVTLPVARWQGQAMPISERLTDSQPSPNGAESTPAPPFQLYLPLVMKGYRPPFPILGLQITYVEDPYGDQREAWRARQAGARWLRQYIYWGGVEPVKTSPRSYNWSPYDTKFANMAEGGMNVIAILGGNPSWAAQYPGGPVTDTVDLTDFLTAAVERYDGDGIDDAPGHPRVEYWELYNEPDLQDERFAGSPGIGFWGNNGAGYAQMLREVYAAIKSANPEAKVVFGGVAHEEVGDNFDLEFIDDVMAYIQSHPGEYFDIMNFHYYLVFEVNYLSWGPDLLGKATYLQEKLASYGINKPVICTEAGYWSSGGPAEFKTGSHEGQSRYVVQLYARSAAADLDASIWYSMIDCENGCPWTEKRGLFDADRNAKPSYNAYRTLVTRLGGTEYSGLLFAYQPPNPGEPGWPLPPHEGYIFDGSSSLRKVYVLWTNDGTTKSVNIPASRAAVFDKFDSSITTVPEVTPFAPFTVRDGDDGRADGMVNISYGPSPIYVQVGG